MLVERFTDLKTWQIARSFRKSVCDLARRPEFSNRVLAQQMMRSADSIPSNIAEGFGRLKLNDRLHYLRMALGSSYETQSHLHLAYDDGLCSAAELAALLELAQSTDRLILGLSRALQVRS
ncbi:MAG: four helix bundle protein [Deltaproteobacteria bacterium]|nr:four helix bundle protein [Deltaproteobacteria bacterium]